MYSWYDDGSVLVIIDDEGVVARVKGANARALRNSLGRTRDESHCALAQYLRSLEEEGEE